MSVAAAPGPVVTESSVCFTLPDPRRAYRRVRLVHELRRPRIGPDFLPAGSAWTLRLPRPPVDRFEYQLELTRAGGRTELACDPGNPLRAAGPFGDKSVVELPGYEPPRWLDQEVSAGKLEPFAVRCRAIRAVLSGLLWTSPGSRPGSPLPLLVVHDGPEYTELSALARFLDRAATSGAVPPMRAALLAPIDRNQNYSASTLYTRALVQDVFPAVHELAPTGRDRRWRVGMGASLGALALLHVHRRYADTFGGLFLQSGSFFRERWDRQESEFVRFRRITRFVGTVLAGQGSSPIPVAMTCGTIEENLANNHIVCAALAAQGYAAGLAEVRDGHNWVAWRDAFDPHLADLLRRTWA